MSWIDSYGLNGEYLDTNHPGDDFTTNVSNLKSQSIAGLNAIGAHMVGGNFLPKVTITGGAETWIHAGGEFSHHSGWKADLDDTFCKPYTPAGIELVNFCHSQGYSIVHEDDHWDINFSGNDSRDKQWGAVTSDTSTESPEKPAETMTNERIEYIDYTVQEGDTIQSVCDTYGCSPAQLVYTNNLKDGKLVAGQTIKIPLTSSTKSKENGSTASSQTITKKHRRQVTISAPYMKVSIATETGMLTFTQSANVNNSNLDRDIVSFTTNRDMGSDCPTFSLTLVWRHDWFDKIGSNDLVVISLARPPEQLEVVFVGLVDDIRRSHSFNTMKPSRTLTISGRGWNKAMVNFIVGTLTEMNTTATCQGFWAGMLNSFSGASPAKIVAAVVKEYVTKGCEYNFADGTKYTDWWRQMITEPKVNYDRMANMTSFLTYQGSLWECLKELKNAPFNEMYWEVVDGKPTFIFRPTPFNERDWCNLSRTVIPDFDIVQESTGRSDLETYSVFQIKMDTFTTDTDALRLLPLWYPPYYKKYGLNKLCITSKYLNAKSNSVSSATGSYGNSGGTGSTGSENTGGSEGTGNTGNTGTGNTGSENTGNAGGSEGNTGSENTGTGGTGNTDTSTGDTSESKPSSDVSVKKDDKTCQVTIEKPAEPKPEEKPAETKPDEEYDVTYRKTVDGKWVKIKRPKNRFSYTTNKYTPKVVIDAKENEILNKINKENGVNTGTSARSSASGSSSTSTGSTTGSTSNTGSSAGTSTGNTTGSAGSTAGSSASGSAGTGGTSLGSSFVDSNKLGIQLNPGEFIDDGKPDFSKVDDILSVMKPDENGIVSNVQSVAQQLGGESSKDAINEIKNKLKNADGQFVNAFGEIEKVVSDVKSGFSKVNPFLRSLPIGGNLLNRLTDSMNDVIQVATKVGNINSTIKGALKTVDSVVKKAEGAVEYYEKQKKEAEDKNKEEQNKEEDNKQETIKQVDYDRLTDLDRAVITLQTKDPVISRKEIFDSFYGEGGKYAEYEEVYRKTVDGKWVKVKKLRVKVDPNPNNDFSYAEVDVPIRDESIEDNKPTGDTPADTPAEGDKPAGDSNTGSAGSDSNPDIHNPDDVTNSTPQDDINGSIRTSGEDSSSDTKATIFGRCKELFNWNILNNQMENGSITVKGSNKYKVGSRVILEATNVEFYVEGVSHNFTQFEGWTTTLQVTRGIEPQRRFQAPWGEWQQMTMEDIGWIFRLESENTAKN